MHLWDGLFRDRPADSPGNSPSTAQLSGVGPNTLPITSNSNNTSADPQQPSWHPVAAVDSSESRRQYQQQFSRSSPALGATANAHNHSSSSSQPVQIPESKVLPYSRLLARSANSISPSPTQNILADSPGTEVLLGLHNLAAAAAAGPSSDGSSTQPQQQQQHNSNLILRAQSRSKRPPLAPSPQTKPQYLSSAAAAGGSSSSSNAPISPRRGGIASQLTAVGSNTSAAAAAAWVPTVPSNSSLTAMYSNPIGSSSSSSGHRNDTSRVLASSGSTGSRRHQQLLQNALHSGSPSPTTEGLLASSLQLSPTAAAAAAAVGEAVAAVAGNPYHPHHQQTMQLLVQHQQLQMQQLQQQQSGLSAAAAAAAAGSVGASVDGFLNPVGDYYGERSAAQQSPQSPGVLSRRNSSSSRLYELGTSPGLIEASFMGMAARPSRKLTHSHSFTAGSSSSSSRRRALQQMQHAEHLAARQQQEQQQRAFGSRGGSAANSPRESQSGSGASLADWDSNNVIFGVTDHITSTAAAASRDPGIQSEVPGQIGSSSSSRDLDQLLTHHWAGRGSNPSSSAASTPLLYDTRYRGGMRALPGQESLTWISRADDGESAARGLLGLPRPGIPLNPSSSDQQQQQGIGRSNTFGGRSSGTVSEIEAHETDHGSGEVSFSGFGHSRTGEQQQQQQGRGAFSGGLMRRAASYGELLATPAKIGAAAAAGGSASYSDSVPPTNSRQPGASAAIPAASGGSSSISNGQLTHTARQASFKRVAAAIAAAPATSPTSSAAAAAAAAAAEDDEPLRRQDSFNSYTSARSDDSSRNFGALPGYVAAVAAVAAAREYEPGMGGSARASSWTSPRAAAARYTHDGSSSQYFSRSYTRNGGNLGYRTTLGRSPSGGGFPTCLICLDHLTPEDFECGEALQLDCRCKGEVALRHRSCAEKWSRIKGNTICDVCKAPILNLPDVPPLPVPSNQGLGNQAATLLNEAGLWGSEEPPAAADYIFDCIRVTWVVLIVCILFLELSVSRSFLTGALIGSAYVAVAASWSAAQRRRRQNRLAAAAAAAGWMGEQQVPLLHGQVGGIEGLPV